MNEMIPNQDRSFDLNEVKLKLPTPLVAKLEHSITLLQKAEHLALQYDPAEGFFCAFSGGKDSQALYHVAKLAGVKFKPHFSPTTVDPPELLRFIRKHYPDCEFEKPKQSIFTSAVARRILPTMRVRWCCEEFKESAGAGKVTLIGIRHEESVRRAKRNEVEINSHRFSGTLEQLDIYRKENAENKEKPHKGRPRKGQKFSIVTASGERTLGCINGKESLLISPIIDWTTRDVWTFLNTLGVEHCSLYDEGWHRIGCILCPMSSPKHKVKEMARWPHVKKKWIEAIKAIRRGVFKSGFIWWNVRHADLRTNSTKRTNYGLWTGFSDGSSSDRLNDEQENEIAENIFDWWISGKAYKKWFADKFTQQKLNFKD